MLRKAGLRMPRVDHDFSGGGAFASIEQMRICHWPIPLKPLFVQRCSYAWHVATSRAMILEIPPVASSVLWTSSQT